MTREIVHYYLPDRQAKNLDGTFRFVPVGPFIVSIEGSYHRDQPLTDEEVRQYVRQIHQVDPVKIERLPVSSKGENDGLAA